MKCLLKVLPTGLSRDFTWVMTMANSSKKNMGHSCSWASHLGKWWARWLSIHCSDFQKSVESRLTTLKAKLAF